MRSLALPPLALPLLAPLSPAQTVVSNVSELLAAVDTANRGGQPAILLVITAPGITVRSLTGVRDAVSIFGQGMNGSVTEIFLVQASGFTARNMTLGKVSTHAIQVQGEVGASDVVLANLRIQDTFEQMVKISYSTTSTNRSRNGVLEGCLLEYTAGIGPQYYIGGIDGHCCKDWLVRGNTFLHISSPGGSMAEHAVHFWSGSEGTVV